MCTHSSKQPINPDIIIKLLYKPFKSLHTMNLIRLPQIKQVG